MSVLQIGGSGRGAGKTAVGCALISALREMRWTAVKVTSHRHAVCGRIWEELDANSPKDTGRYLAAGSSRSFLIMGDAGEPKSREPLTRPVAVASLLVESNQRLADLFGPDFAALTVYIVVIGSKKSVWKDSLRERIAEADALVLSGGLTLADLPDGMAGKPIFILPAEAWITPELLEFVRLRLLPAGESSLD